MKHPNYVNFRNEVYKELDTLKAKLNRSQLTSLEGFNSTTIKKTLYGCLYANTASSHAKKLYPKNFQDALLDLNDKDAFNAGQNHTALEKLLNNRNDLSKEVYQYVSGKIKETVGIDSYIRDLENQMIEMDKPKVVPVEEVAPVAEVVELEVTDLVKEEYIFVEERESSPIGDVIVFKKKLKKEPVKKKEVEPLKDITSKKVETQFDQDIKNIAKRVSATSRKIDKKFEELEEIKKEPVVETQVEADEVTEDTTKPKVEKEFIFDLSLPVKKDNGLVIEKTTEFIM